MRAPAVVLANLKRLDSYAKSVDRLVAGEHAGVVERGSGRGNVRTDEFRAWLKNRTWNGKSITTSGLRVSKARRFEKAMAEFAFGAADLDGAYDADELTAVMRRLGELTKHAQATGDAPTVLVGNSRIAGQHMASLTAAVRNYRDFRAGAETEVPPIEDRPILLLDGEGKRFVPVRQTNVNGGTAMYRIKPAGATNRRDG